MADEQKTSWLTSAAPLIGSALDFVSGVGSGLFNMNQARKNRAFQERMYNKQVEDNIRLWKMNNEYNLPSAVLQRMEDANLNPLLMYEGGTSLTSSSVAQGGNAPSGDSARMQLPTNFTSAASQSALMDAQTRKLNAESANLEQQTDESWTRTDWYRSTKGLQAALLRKNVAKADYEITQIATATNSLASMTWKNLEVMDKSMEMMDKQLDISERDLQNRIAYNIASISLGRAQVNAQLKQISVNMYNAVTQRMVSLKEIEKMTYEIKKIVADTALSEAERDAKVNDIIHGKIGNILFSHYGVDNMAGAAGALLLLSTAIAGDFEPDVNELKQMYKQYGIDF